MSGVAYSMLVSEVNWVAIRCELNVIVRTVVNSQPHLIAAPSCSSLLFTVCATYCAGLQYVEQTCAKFRSAVFQGPTLQSAGIQVVMDLLQQDYTLFWFAVC
jgi:hypothetical protein